MTERERDRALRKICCDLTYEYFGNPLTIGGWFLRPDGKTLVEITDGQFMGTHGLSNFWYWRVVKDGKMVGPVHHGYGWTPPDPEPLRERRKPSA